MQQLQFIVIGDPASPSFTFEGDDILSTSGDFSVDMIGAELCTDVMEAEISYDDTDGTLRALPWATPVYFYRGEHLEGKLYLVSVTRTGRTAYRLRTASAAGIMDYDTFYGGMYTGQTFRTVCEWIIGSNGLQPYEGVYSRIFIEETATTHSFLGRGMGKYFDMELTPPTGSGSGLFLTATMSSKLFTKVKILGFANHPGITGTIHRDYFLGVLAEENASVNLKKHQYGMYMQMTRASASDPFPAFGEVFFVYGQTEISLGMPASADEALYEIEVDPVAGTAVINDVTYPIAFDSSVADDPCALHVYGGGAYYYERFYGSIEATAVSYHCQSEIYYYIVRGHGGELQANFAAVKDVYTGEIGYFDNVSHKFYHYVQYPSVLPSDLSAYDESIYGFFPLFRRRTDFDNDVIDRLTYANGIDTIPIYGWIPICTKRQALQQLLFATGVILVKRDDGAILFTAPSTVSAESIDSDAIYDVGSEDQPDHINNVLLTEHSYSLNTASDLESIYENDAGSSGEFYAALFSIAPAKQESSNGLTCLYSNCNAAWVKGTGNLTGYPYYHAETIQSRAIAGYPDGRAISVADATLVTMLNSETVLDRLEAYYGAARKTRVDIAQNGERCGLLYTLVSAFGESFSGFLVRASKVITSIVKAACEFVVSYTPPQIGDSYTHYVILTGTGTWTVPASVFEKETPRIHVVLIGGGRGGDSGFAGADGVQPEVGGGASAAEGGAIGDSGIGGKIFEVTITNPAASYDYSCGQGGAGGAISNSHSSNNPGSDGGDTTLSVGGQSYSSASGASSETGISNAINGDRYASRLIHSWNAETASESGGGEGGYQSYDNDSNTILHHNSGACVKVIMNRTYGFGWTGGKSGADYVRDGNVVYACGGGGGGAGYGQNGFAGSDATYANRRYTSGSGGKGGDATDTPKKATVFNPKYYGYGGLGGGGGGGGGAAGFVYSSSHSYVGTPGAGGYGGRGGDGGDGCVLIYY